MFRSIAFIALISSTPVLANCPAEPQSNYDTSQAGLVKDTKTGLTWMRCSLGMDWLENACQGNPGRYEWQQAKNVIKELNDEGGFAGKKDWRLPTLEELRSIVNSNCFHPAIDSNTFTDIEPAGYWTSNEDKMFSNAAIVVHFYNGGDYLSNKLKPWFVRPVRK